jgi:hypothetical protein
MKTLEIKLPAGFTDREALRDYFHVSDPVLDKMIAHAGWLRIDVKRGRLMALDPRFNGLATRDPEPVLSVEWWLSPRDPVVYTPTTRADLMQRPAWAGMGTDCGGNPRVWRNVYHCDCSGQSRTYADDWSCQCDDRCPECDAELSPEESVWIGPEDAAERALWEALEDHP